MRLNSLLTFGCRKFFGAKGTPPPKQTKLSFATKAKDDDAEGSDTKENSDPQAGTSMC